HPQWTLAPLPSDCRWLCRRGRGGHLRDRHFALSSALWAVDWALSTRLLRAASSSWPLEMPGSDCTTTLRSASWTWLQAPLNGVPTDFEAESTIAASAGSDCSFLASSALVGSSPKVL